MKIQIFTKHFVGDSLNFKGVDKTNLVGGAEVYVYDLANLLKEFTDEIEIIQTGNGKNVKWDDILIKKVRISPLEEKTLPFLNTSRIFSRFADKNALKIFSGPYYSLYSSYRESPSVGICHGVEWDMNYLSFIKLCTLTDCHGKLSNFLWANLTYLYFGKILLHATKASIEHLNEVISVDHEVLGYLSENQKQKVRVIPSYVDFDYFNDKVVSLEKEKNIILVPRNLTFARGVHLIPDVAKKLSIEREDFEFWITGIGALEKYIKKRTRDMGVGKFVKLLGHKDHYLDMPKLYATSDIVLVPSIYSEGMSLSALEGMAAKRTVITTNTGGLKEIGNNGEDRLEVKPDANDIAGKISLVLNDHRLAKKIATNGFNYVRRNHSIEKWREEWRKVLLKYFT